MGWWIICKTRHFARSRRTTRWWSGAFHLEGVCSLAYFTKSKSVIDLIQVFTFFSQPYKGVAFEEYCPYAMLISTISGWKRTLLGLRNGSSKIPSITVKPIVVDHRHRYHHRHHLRVIVVLYCYCLLCLLLFLSVCLQYVVFYTLYVDFGTKPSPGHKKRMMKSLNWKHSSFVLIPLLFFSVSILVFTQTTYDYEMHT